jgi:nitrogen regulatory protein P-II 1
MYLLRANIPIGSVTELTKALMDLGVSRVRLADVCGYTDGIQEERVYRGRRFVVQLVHEIDLEALVPNESVDEAIDVVMRTVRRLHDGDGFISITLLEQCFRISTGNPQF